MLSSPKARVLHLLLFVGSHHLYLPTLTIPITIHNSLMVTTSPTSGERTRGPVGPTNREEALYREQCRPHRPDRWQIYCISLFSLNHWLSLPKLSQMPAINSTHHEPGFSIIAYQLKQQAVKTLESHPWLCLNVYSWWLHKSKWSVFQVCALVSWTKYFKIEDHLITSTFCQNSDSLRTSSWVHFTP